MRIFGILLIIIAGFILNIGLYYVSDEYRSLLKSLKNNDTRIEVTDEYEITQEEVEESLEEELGKPISTHLENKEGDIQSIEYQSDNDDQIIEMSEYGNTVLELFNEYNFVELQSHGTLLDVNEEYPDEYFEYYNPEITLVFFPTKNYKEVKEIFEIVSYGDIFTINELDNFGEESFYINLGESFDDGFVRIILSKNGTTFGLKISKNKYNDVKEVLKNI